MQGVRCRPLPRGGAAVAAAGLTIDGGEAPETRMERLIRENPVVIFTRRGCCMCHVMKRLLATVGAHPTVIEVEGAEEEAAAALLLAAGGSPRSSSAAPRRRDRGAHGPPPQRPPRPQAQGGGRPLRLNHDDDDDDDDDDG
ncbi:Glutaredoxin-C7 [Ananas comosus]|uniref:Glutaredoxin-C7 n=1 Tax=Ananas comosus TaxID=4615 RepID=A0A199W2B7_ANACO|nr:Glutaredoxin-C7 [Ananas comosus]